MRLSMHLSYENTECIAYTLIDNGMAEITTRISFAYPRNICKKEKDAYGLLAPAVHRKTRHVRVACLCRASKHLYVLCLEKKKGERFNSSKYYLRGAVYRQVCCKVFGVISHKSEC
jgi:hypothetical protein